MTLPLAKPVLSIVLPAIRKDRWDNLYDSILGACKRYSFELILCGPLPLTEKLQSLPNVKYVKDLGSPMRASNIAASLAEGQLITWIADDALLLEDSLDKNIDLLFSLGTDETNCVMIKYFEGKNGTVKPELPDEYFRINNSGNASPYLKNEWLLFNHVLMYRKFFDELGGWDCSYQCCPMGHNDFAIRAQQVGAKVVISPYACLDCDHMEGDTVDHRPIFLVQTHVDQPYYQNKFRNPDWVFGELYLSITNWKNADAIWNKRFVTGKVPKDYQDILDENKLSSL
jgi:hypothetical protein